jgi:PEP-CTERM motif
MRKSFASLVITLVVGLSHESCRAGIVLSTPAGLNPGDTFRFVFVTETITTATSADINYYDSIVSAEAASLGVTYQGHALTWQAIASTPTVSAITHIGSNNHDQVFLSDGTRVATSTDKSAGGLWANLPVSFALPLEHSIDLDLSGVHPHQNPIPVFNKYVWTGTDLDGSNSMYGGHPLGSQDGGAGGGFNTLTDSGWISNFGGLQSGHYSLYGISQEITVASPSAVPEPSTFALLALGASGLAIRALRKRWMTAT